MRCPYCDSSVVVKNGRNRSGSQRYLCRDCGKGFTPEPRPKGYPREMRHEAVRLYLEGMNLRRIGRMLSVHHQTVANWLKLHAEELPEVEVPQEAEAVEVDELYTFVGCKKTRSTSSPWWSGAPGAS